jgi:asparagine synthase (glutamine-hydrolysing)
MMERMRHRGPDGHGRQSVGTCSLGHVRLAIVDVEGGAQPIANENSDLVITFNGEIYNHLELRRRIDARHKFRTRSDTEVLVHLYEEIGEDMLVELDGMFAMALAGPEGVLLARDPVGIKPLYYGWKDEAFLAASELGCFPRMDSLHQLPAGTMLRPESEPRHFALPFPPPHPVFAPSVDDAQQEVRRRLEEAVAKRLMGDVPVGVFLSGGLDSSLIAAIMRPATVNLHSFTAGIAGAPDLEAARIVADYLGTEHHELVYTQEDVERALPDVIRHLESFDAPLVRSAIPMYFVSRVASRHVKVVLTGEGADELFAGYEYLKRLGGGNRLRSEQHNILVRLQDTNLQRADRMTMAHGLEGRVPFLDIGLIRYVMRLPTSYLEPQPGRPEKWFLREACHGLVPKPILERKKMKFSEGAGSAEVVAQRLASDIGASEFKRQREIAPGFLLRSPEELVYYRIWRQVFGEDLPPSLVGRTQDMTAAGGKPDV